MFDNIQPRILINRCQCTVCFDIIESKHRHHFVTCKCGRIFTDGGTWYLHRGFTYPSDLHDLTEYEGTLIPTKPLTKP
jgi:hypothetical protein